MNAHLPLTAKAKAMNGWPLQTPEQKALEANMEALSRLDNSYPGHWIAIVNGEVVAFSKDFKELLAEIRSRTWTFRPLLHLCGPHKPMF